jgi:O-antigen/teichoic acid export membrane protein
LAFVVINLVKLFLQLSLNIVFLVPMRMAAQGVLLATLIANAVLGLGLAVFLIREVGLRPSAGRARDLLRFGIPLMGTQVATFFATFGDRYFLQKATDSAAVGLYTLAYQFGFLLIAVGYLPFQTAWDPARFAVAKRPRHERDAVYASAFVRANTLVMTVAVCLALFAGDVLRIMAAPTFHPAADLVPLILIAYVLKSWTSFQNLGILVRERTEFVTLTDWAAALTALAGYVWLIPRLHGLGAALATVASFGVRQAIMYSISQRLWPVCYEWGPVRRLVAVAVAASLAGLVVPQRNLFISLGFHALLFLAYLLAVWHLRVLSGRDREKVRAGARLLRQWISVRIAKLLVEPSVPRDHR